MLSRYKRYPMYGFIFVVILFFPLTSTAQNTHQTGFVRSGKDPIVSSKVTLYQTRGRHGHSGDVLGTARTDENGYFKISFKIPNSGKTILYLIAEGGSISESEDTGKWSENINGWSGRRKKWHGKLEKHLGGRHGHNSGPVSFASVLGKSPTLNNVVLNELTTVATAYTMAQFLKGNIIRGRGPGVGNAADILQANLVNIYTGEVANFLKVIPNGTDTSTWWTFNSLANLLAACVNDESQCDTLFQLTTPPGGKAPHNTLQAAVNIAHFPWQNLQDLFNLSQTVNLYHPALPFDALTSNLINSWVLALRYVGEGPYNNQGFDGPGNVAFDKKGNAWVNNNYAFNPDPNATVCGSTRLLKLTPTGRNAPGAPFGGVVEGGGVGAGGLYGAGFGIAVDPKGNVWITNFGFQSPGCPFEVTKLFVSVSKFNKKGEPRSPDGDPASNEAGGYQGTGNIAAPQGVLSDRHGNVWFANCDSQSVTVFRKGNPSKVENFDDIMVQKPFDVTFDARGHVWVTGNLTNNVVELNRKGKPINEVSDVRRPMGVASDSFGNIWIAGAGVRNPPCPALRQGDLPVIDDVNDTPLSDDGSNNILATATLIRQSRGQLKVKIFRKDGGVRDGLRWPWGIAVDSNDNVWVANFAGQRIMPLCGVRENRFCPPEVKTGDPLGPDSGYFFNGLARITGIQIDPSGNVWAVNNWRLDGFQVENPGGNQVVVFLGLAGPVKSPLLGPPQRP